jgi:hypothetical protein
MSNQIVRRIAAALGALLVGGCGGLWPEVVDTRSLFAGGTPSVSRIRDLGTAEPPERGPMSGDPDGVASPGELLLIEGSGFGKQPTVTVSGRSTEVVARTSGGGIVVRVPVAVGTGPQPVEVTVEDTKTKQLFPLRRLALLLHRDKLYTLSVEAGGAKLIGTLDLPGARALRVSSDGGLAYVLTGKSKITVVDLGAAGAPKVFTTRDLEMPAFHLVAAERAPIIFAVGDGAIEAFETKIPRQPAQYQKVELPPETKGARFVELDPDGKRLAFLIPDGNKFVLVDVANPREAKLVTTLPVLPEKRVPLVRDLRFSSDGETIWILSGDNEASLPSGVEPTRVTGLRIEGAESPTVTPWRTSPVGGAGAPLRLLIPRQPPLASATTIRMPPEKATVYFTSASNTLWSAGDASATAALFAGKNPGAIDRADMAGGAGHLVETPLLVGAADTTPDGLVALTAAGRVAPTGREFGFAVAPLKEKSELTFTKLSAAAEQDFAPPFFLGEVRLQP